MLLSLTSISSPRSWRRYWGACEGGLIYNFHVCFRDDGCRTYSMRSIELTFSAFLLLVVLVLGGCASGPFTMVPAPPKAPKPPFAYEPLNVHNSCFVESVNFYDHYYAQKRENTLPWARILEWGIQEGSFGIAAGHAVTVFVLNDQVWAYDVNFGFEPLGLAVARRGDITDVSPPIFSKYPKSH